MSKKRKRKFPTKKLKNKLNLSAPEQYAVIQMRLRSGDRTWFDSEGEAIAEAQGLLKGTVEYANYKTPRELGVVKLVGKVTADIKTAYKKQK